jgi:hypothetical protein
MRWAAGLPIVTLALFVGACGGSGTGSGAGPGPKAAAAKGCAPAGEQTGDLRWYTDDYQAAAACAKATGRPLFIDLWAPWCHTCLSMKSYVFPDPGLSTMADRFVWLAVDTDVELNASLLTKFPPEVWPTFFVVDAEDESIQARYLGSASVTQLREFLKEAELAYVGARSGGLAADDPIRLVREGHQAEAAGDLPAASKAYGAALAGAPTRWPRRPDVLVSRIRVLASMEDWPTCAALGAGAADQTGNTSSASDFAYFALECAARLTDAAQKKSLYTLFEDRLERLAGDESAPLSVDDRADAFRILRGAREELGDQAGARAAAEAGRALLDRAAAEAPNPLAASTHNYLRVDVYMWLGLGKELVPILEKSAADLPREYDPAYRLASVYLGLDDSARALHWAEKALALSYGPRKARMQQMIAEIHKSRGDKPAELAARRAVVKLYEELPEGQQQPVQLERARQALAELEKK